MDRRTRRRAARGAARLGDGRTLAGLLRGLVPGAGQSPCSLQYPIWRRRPPPHARPWLGPGGSRAAGALRRAGVRRLPFQYCGIAFPELEPEYPGERQKPLARSGRGAGLCRRGVGKRSHGPGADPRELSRPDWCTGRQLLSCRRAPALGCVVDPRSDADIRSGNDFWSQPEDARSLQEHLVHAPETRLVVLPDATHYVHLDRPERGRDQFVREVLEFIGGE